MFKRRGVLLVLWLTFITVVAWIGFHIYHITVTSTISEELQLQIIPIDPNFDMDTINRLKGRVKVEPLYQFNENTASASPLSGADADVADPVSIGAEANSPPADTGQGPIDASPTTDSPQSLGSEGQAEPGDERATDEGISPTESTLPLVTGAP